jgi:hypothetical protein
MGLCDGISSKSCNYILIFLFFYDRLKLKVGENMRKKIDFENISYCEIVDTEMTYRKQKRYFWQRYYYDGGIHSIPFANTYNVENGLNYTFLIYYKNGRAPETRTYHESSYMCRLLIEKLENNDITEGVKEVVNAFQNFGSGTNKPTDLKVYYDSCLECMKEEASLFNYSKQELLDEVSKYYSEEEIQKSLTRINIDFKEQAVKAAKEYLEFDNYTYESMVVELLSDKFTKEEAEYAASNLNLKREK